jgi:hypothetical protein
MKKRHYIQLFIIVAVALVYVSVKTGLLRIEHTIVVDPIEEGVTTVTVRGSETYYLGEKPDNKPPDNKIQYTEVSYKGSSIKINRSEYSSDVEFQSAVEEATTKLKEK